MGKQRAILAGLTLALATAFTPAAAIEARLASMGTGSLAGVYFPVGVALCRLVNLDRPTHGIRCAARPSAGSVANIDALRAQGINLAIIQSDIQQAALDGTGSFAEAGAYPDLRAVMALHPEPLTIVAGRDTGITSLMDLPGKRVSIGAAGSGQRALMDVLMAELGWTPDTFAEAAELAPEQLSSALCAGGIDAFVFAVGHPALVIQEATRGCDARIVPAEGPEITALTTDNPAFFTTEIPGGLYNANPDPVPTFGVGAALVTRSDLPEEEIYTITGSIFDNFDMLIGLNPALANLDPREMSERGLTAPLHPGAARYFREQGWLP